MLLVQMTGNATFLSDKFGFLLHQSNELLTRAKEDAILIIIPEHAHLLKSLELLANVLQRFRNATLIYVEDCYVIAGASEQHGP